nr:MAG TPA: hypothetical protein [Caudoviricetes sp.]
MINKPVPRAHTTLHHHCGVTRVAGFIFLTNERSNNIH